MLKRFLKIQFGHLLCVILIASFFLHVEESYAVYDGERSPIGYNSSSDRCTTGSFEFDPGTGNKDMDWEITNPVCASFIAIQGALILSAGLVVRVMCNPSNIYGTTSAIKENAEEAATPDLPMITPLTIYKLGSRASRCGARTYESALASSILAQCLTTAALTAGGASAVCAPASAQVPIASADQTRCCTSYAAYAAAVAAGFAALAVVYASAKGAYENARICGHDWNVWKEVDENGEYNSNEPKVRWRLGKYPGSRQYCIEDLFVGHEDPSNPGAVVYDSCHYGQAAKVVDIKNRYYREYLYGGKEFSDSGCKNPSSWDKAHRLKNLGYDDDNQRYYMTGSGVASNYACHRFVLEAANDPKVNEAYECCKKRSQNSICIENAPMKIDLSDVGSVVEAAPIKADASALDSVQGSFDTTFCELGSLCTSKGIVFNPYASKVSPNFICVKTYSVCPYNHLLGGGTETAIYKTNPDGTPTSDLKNFCQYRNHCVKVPVLPYIRISNLDGAYISAACRNLIGDSQNVYGYSSELLPINNRGFAAPIVQCFKESFENTLLNKAGDTKCRNPDERPVNDVCTSGYFYKKDQPLDENASFFVRIQNMLKGVIKMALTLSITLLGAMLLLGVVEANKKELLMYLLKIGLVMYFALGNAWQSGFVSGILSSSNYLSDIMMRLDYSDGPQNYRDGCQFPRFQYNDKNEETKYNNPSYPPGKEYIKIWDVLDCKLARALGFGPELSVPNLVKMIFAGFLTGGLGIIFLVAVFMFAFFMLAVTMRAIHIFLMAAVAIIILIYVSPITITLAMFERTKGIFSGWLKQLIGLSLQPVILFAYLGIYISIFDNLVIGKATFSGDGRSVPKTVVCNAESADTSIYCIFRIADIKTYSGLEVIGIGLPVLASMNSTKLNTIIKSAFIMFIFAQFMDKISTLAAELVGGAELQSNSISAMGMAKKSFGALSAIQSRALRGMKKHGGGAVRAIASKAKNAAYAASFRGYAANSGAQAKKSDEAGTSNKNEGSDQANSRKNSKPEGPSSTQAKNP